MFCPKCGAQNPDGSAFCAGCGQPLAPQPVTPQAPAAAAPGPQPMGAQPAPNFGQPATSRAAGVGAYAVRGAHPGMVTSTQLNYVLAAVLVLAGIFMFQNWVEMPLAQIAQSTGSSLPAGVPSAIGMALLGLSQFVGFIGSLGSYASYALGSGSSDASAFFSGITGASMPLTIVSLVWVAALVLVVINAYELLVHKTLKDKLMIACGAVLALLSVVWVFIVNSADGQIVNSIRSAAGSYSSQIPSFHMLAPTLFVWLTLVCGVVCVVVPILKKKGILH